VRLPRIQAFELNDSSWAPAALRDTVIESLSRTLAWGRILRGLVAPFEDFLAASGTNEVLDIASGAGGPAKILVREILAAGRKPPHFLLTDLAPQREAWEQAVAELPDVLDFEPSPVDATRIPERLARGRARVIINAFHHFPPELARGILEDAVRARAPIFIAEGFERNPLRFVPFVPAGLLALAVNPWLSGRDRLAKAFFTYATPIAALASVFDGFVSTLRVYSREDLEAMVAPFGATYAWTWGTYDFAPGGRGTYFHGVPERPAARV
jgi:hypothetical protein